MDKYHIKSRTDWYVSTRPDPLPTAEPLPSEKSRFAVSALDFTRNGNNKSIASTLHETTSGFDELIRVSSQCTHSNASGTRRRRLSRAANRGSNNYAMLAVDGTDAHCKTSAVRRQASHLVMGRNWLRRPKHGIRQDFRELTTRFRHGKLEAATKAIRTRTRQSNKAKRDS